MCDIRHYANGAPSQTRYVPEPRGYRPKIEFSIGSKTKSRPSFMGSSRVARVATRLDGDVENGWPAARKGGRLSFQGVAVTRPSAAPPRWRFAAGWDNRSR
jgi:hypothetical protein